MTGDIPAAPTNEDVIAFARAFVASLDADGNVTEESDAIDKEYDARFAAYNAWDSSRDEQEIY